jgi:leucyl aminopeptidase
MTLPFAARADRRTLPITPLSAADLKSWLARQSAAARAWIEGNGFAARPGDSLVLPAEGGGPARVLLGIDPAPARGDDVWAYGGLPDKLPAGSYRIDAKLDATQASRAALGWGLACYRFTRYKRNDRPWPVLVWPEGADRAEIERACRAQFLARDLVNTPAEDMGPDALADAARAVAKAHKAKIEVIVGDQLLKRGYPTIHAVGRAAAKAPRLIDLRWGRPGDPKLTLIGKGVCFDSGGLDLKPSAGMKMMKKDMGGAAAVLALADRIMGAKLRVRLRLMIPAVENMVAGNAFHPLDIIRTRGGKTVEVGNTDAEGRLILCDAISEAMTEKPALAIDMATLTGAARVALGPDLPALFCNDDGLAEATLRHGLAQSDPLWRLPLWPPYRQMLETRIADLSSTGDSPMAGSITAALFLESFVDAKVPWIHIDTFAWNPRSRPGRPEGGEALGMRALYAMIRERFAG